MQRHHLDSKVVTPSDEESRIGGPRDADYIFRMQVSVLLIQNHWRELLERHWRCFKDFEPLSGRYCEELGIGRELDGRDFISEVEMRNHDLLRVVNNQSESVNIDSDQSRAIRRQKNLVDVAPILEWQCPRDVAIKQSVKIYLIKTYLVRSKAETLLPTGDKRIWSLTSLPDGDFFSVNKMFPPVYTVPQRFENCR